MPAKGASARVIAKAAPKSVHATGGKLGATKTHLTKLEAKRLASFKALMANYGGECTLCRVRSVRSSFDFANFDLIREYRTFKLEVW